MNSFKAYLEAEGKTKSTIIHYNNYILDFISYLDKDNTEIENVTAKEVMAYMNILQKRGYENKTRNTRLGIIKKYFNWQIEQEKRSSNPISHLSIRGSKKQKLYNILSLEELEQLYHQYQIPTQEHKKANCNWFKSYELGRKRNKAVLSLMVNQGLTTAEVSRIEINDLQLKQGNLYIKGTRKSNERTLALKAHQIIELMEYSLQLRQLFIPYQKEKTNQLFLSLPTAGKQKSKTKNSLHIWKSLSKTLKETHPKYINFKQVRASVITHWLKQYNLRQVQYMAGHRYVSSTESYLVNQVEDLQADIDNFHPF